MFLGPETAQRLVIVPLGAKNDFPYSFLTPFWRRIEVEHRCLLFPCGTPFETLVLVAIKIQQNMRLSFLFAL